MIRLFLALLLGLSAFAVSGFAATEEKEVILEEVINEAGLEPVKITEVEEAPKEVVLEPAVEPAIQKVQTDPQE